MINYFGTLPLLICQMKARVFVTIIYVVSIEVSMIEQVASNKSSLFLKNILQSTQSLQLFTMNIKTESIYKSN